MKTNVTLPDELPAGAPAQAGRREQDRRMARRP